MGRLIKFLWLLSLGLGLFSLLYTYAALGHQVEFGEYSFDRETYFYAGLVLLVIFNFTFYAISRNLRYTNEKLRDAMVNWQLSFAGVLNIFFIVSVFFIMLLNSGEQFNFNSFGYLLYVCLGLIVIWIVALPVIITKTAIRK